jgi:probable HAF family extracellular repeat protein
MNATARRAAAFGSGYAIAWEQGQIASLGGVFDYGGSAGTSINDAGDITGVTWVNPYEPGHPFLYRDGKLTPLGTGYGVSGSWAAPAAINNDRVIVGSRRASVSGVERGFLWRDGAFRDLGSLGGTAPGSWSTLTSAEDINDRGQVVGSSLPAKGAPLHPFIWENGKMRDLGVLGPDTEATQAFAINNDGVVVGSSQAPSLEIGGRDLDTSWRNQPLTVAGRPPITAEGRWVDGLRFDGGRLLIPPTTVPLQHEFAACQSAWAAGRIDPGTLTPSCVYADRWMSSTHSTRCGFGSTSGRSRLTTTASCPDRTTTHDSGSDASALISWCGTYGGT